MRASLLSLMFVFVWVASPSANNTNNVMNVNYNGNVNNNNYNNNNIGFRPLASKKLWLYLLWQNKRRFRQKQTTSFSQRITIKYKIDN